ncbi:hypothetical protein Pmani_038851 [Petrolisthes manimaculis]|uniref:Uncharacterized protein n=1 Tax=Petrolisthes manimaculis TaxID=1843537 RepID=A0AAE1NDK4_9EUCA|nr:hypothetical protein Pmani_038851 [Petrolisthes manimaculis]
MNPTRGRSDLNQETAEYEDVRVGVTQGHPTLHLDIHPPLHPPSTSPPTLHHIHSLLHTSLHPPPHHFTTHHSHHHTSPPTPLHLTTSPFPVHHTSPPTLHLTSLTLTNLLHPHLSLITSHHQQQTPSISVGAELHLREERSSQHHDQPTNQPPAREGTGHRHDAFFLFESSPVLDLDILSYLATVLLRIFVLLGACG